MANSIAYAARYVPVLDAVYAAESKTSILDANQDLVKESDGVGEIKIAKVSMDGLGDFSRASGYAEGATNLAWETVKFDKERSQTLKVDRLDNAESMDILFGRVGGEFVRTKVVPEIDAYRIAKIVGTSGITKVTETVDAATIVAKLRAAAVAMDNAAVPENDRVLFITPANLALIEDLDTNKSKAVLSRFSTIQTVTPNVFKSAIELADGSSAFGFKPASGAVDVNFLAVDKAAIVTATRQYLKYFSPDVDQDGDNHVFKYRLGYLCQVLENKVAGVYASIASA